MNSKAVARGPAVLPSGDAAAPRAADERSAAWPLAGIDFSCAPTRRKPITVALGERRGTVVTLEGVHDHVAFAGYTAWLTAPGARWLGAFDFPFGLPRAFVAAQGLGDDVATVLRAVRARCANRMAFRRLVDEWGNTRPAGQRLLHRGCDRAMPGVTSTSPMQTRYVPVGLMYYEGFAQLLDAGVSIAGLHAGDAGRVALEGYPGLLAHELIGRRSYKNTDDADRLFARKEIVDKLEQGATRLGLRLRLSHAKRDALTADASGDRLDAVLCLMQAAWASTEPGFGLPPDIDPIEGWIATTPWAT